MPDLNLNVFDTSTVLEESTCIGDVCTFFAFDPITMTEVPALSLDVLNASGDDSVTASESAPVECPCDFSVFDTVAAADLGDIRGILEADDSVAVTEAPTVTFDIFLVDVFDLIAATDVPILTDIIIETGPGVDTITVTDVLTDILFANPAEGDDAVAVAEALTAFLSELFLSVEDAADAEEAPSLLPDELFLSATDDVTVDDHGDIFPFINASETVSIDEAPTIAVDLAVDVFDNILVAEFVSIFDIIIELGPVFEEITVDDVAFLPTFDIELFVFEPAGAGITESIETQFFFVFVDVSDTLGAPIEAVIVIIVFVVDVLDTVAAIDVVAGITVGLAAEGFDDIAATDVIFIARDILFAAVDEPVAIEEFAILGLSVFDLFVSKDDITAADIAFASTELDLSFNDFLRSYPYVEDTIRNVRVEVFENGAEQRRDIWGRSRKRFTIEFAPRVKSEVDDLREFYEAKAGPGLAFNFTNPLDSVTRSVRFEENSLIISRNAFGVFAARFVVVEVF